MLLLALLACTGATPEDTGAAPLEPTLTNVQAEIFDKSCAFSTCHGEGSGSANLSLVPGASHAEIVGVASEDSAGQTLVVAGDSAASYLVTKCTPGATITGEPMPEGSDGLDEERLALLSDWIDAGAADD